MSTMDFSSLNVDVLLYLMKYLDPDDRFNLVLSGILKGFENANDGIDLRERYSEYLFWMRFKLCDKNVVCPELMRLELNWGYVVMARASWKSGKSSIEKLYRTLKSVECDFGQIVEN
jgi:hypothetical protein